MTAATFIDAPSQTAKSIRAVVIAGSIGTVIEWYDFLIYATSAALVFNKLFFPLGNPTIATITALGSYAVGFVARPFGGMLFGHFGDRVGRKSMLMATMMIMGLATFAIGLLPTYASIGILAPILLVLLRVIQGIGLGGEWGGASLMVLEHAPAERRGFYGSLVQVGFPVGMVLSTLTVSTMARLPTADFLSWGWRVPFLLSAVLFGVGVYMRSRVAESPVFLKMQETRDVAERPIIEALTTGRGSFLTAVGLKLTEVSWVYILTVFIVVYATANLHLTKAMILDTVLFAAALELVTIPLFGWLSDQVGRRPIYFLGSLFTVLFAFPLFWMIDTKDPLLVGLGIAIAMNLGHGLMFAPESTYFPELFKGRMRCTGASFGFQVSAAVGGGFAPIVATGLLGYYGGTAGVSLMLILFAVITFAATLRARETRWESLI